MILLLLLPFAGLSQSDSACYSHVENKKIAEGLLRGKQCEYNIEQMRLSYDDCKIENQGLIGTVAKKDQEISDLTKTIGEKDILIDRLEQKVKRKNRLIIVETAIIAIETIFLMR